MLTTHVSDKTCTKNHRKYSYKSFNYYIKNYYNEKENPLKNKEKIWHVTKQDLLAVYTPEEGLKPSLLNRKMQKKTRARPHHVSARMAKMDMTDNPKCPPACG